MRRVKKKPEPEVRTAGGKRSLADMPVSVEQIHAWMASPGAKMRVKLPNATTAEWMTFDEYVASQGWERVAE